MNTVLEAGYGLLDRVCYFSPPGPLQLKLAGNLLGVGSGLRSAHSYSISIASTAA